MEEIKAGDIMINNWFIGYDDKPVQWKIDDFSDLLFVYPDEIIKSPIPLTEDILLKAGFEKRGKDIYSTKYGFILRKPKSDCYIFRSENINKDLWNVHVLMYLHQLQNLFKALTGNGLEINL